MSKRALVLLANGAEEMEAVISIDVLRRAKIDVTVAGVDSSDKIKCSRGVCIVPDVDIETAMKEAPYDVLVLPGGGPGAKTLAASSKVKTLLMKQREHSKLIGAICAAPIALKSHGIQPGTEITSHPGVKDQLEGYKYSEARVVKDNKIITSRGPGTAFEFSLAIVEELCGVQVRDEISGPMILYYTFFMMDAILKYSNDIQGRDKLYRTVQYLSKFLGWYMIKYNTDLSALKTIQELEKMMSTSRKLFRFGRCIHSFRAAQKSINLDDAILRFTSTTSHLNKVFYLLLDHYIWLGRAGLITTDMKKWGTASFRFWFASLVMDLAKDFYVLSACLERTAQEKEFEGQSNPASTLLKTLGREKNITVDLIKNGCNIVIPMSSLGYLNVNNGVVGLCGVVSSVLAGLQIAYPSLALKP